MVIDVTQESFQEDVLNADRPVLVDFWADWCMPCKMIEPVLEELAEELSDSLTVARINVDQQSSLAAQHNVVSIPAVLLFKDGKVVNQQIGAAPKETFRQLVQPVI